MTISKVDTKVIRKLLYQRRFAADPVSPGAVTGWFPADERGRVEQAIDRMAADPDAPLRPAQDGPQVCLCGIEDTLKYLDKHDADIPSGFDVFVKSPPVK